MIEVTLEFYSKETEFLEKEYKIQLPQNMVFEIAKTNDTELIKCLGWDISDEISAYVNIHYPEISKDLKIFHVQFTGSTG